MSTKTTSLFPRELVREAFTQSFVKLAPRTMLRNPVIFTVEIGTLIMLLVTLYTAFSGDGSQGSFGYNLTAVSYTHLAEMAWQRTLRFLRKHLKNKEH